MLAAAGRRVALVDRRGLVAGSTAASTALLQFELDMPLIHLKRLIGARPAERAWLRSAAALESLRALVRSQRLDATVRRRPSVYVAGDVLGARELQREHVARSRIGLSSEYLDRSALRARFALERSGAIASKGNLNADPRALTAGILRRALRHRARLLAPYEVTEVQTSARRVLVNTKQGLEIEAKHVVFCTGYEMLAFVPRHGHRIASTWAIATRPQPRRLWPEQCLIWEASDPYLYVRSTTDGRVICGGEDAEFSDETRRDALLDQKARTLSRKLGALLPQIDPRPEYRWAGSFGESATGLPSIGAVPGHPRSFAVMGYGGNGITFAMLAAELLTGAINGRRDADAALFAFR